MSRTTTIQVGERGFRASADAFGAWMAYLVEEMADSAFTELAEEWRVAAVVTDFGANSGDLTGAQLQQWIVLDDTPVAGGSPANTTLAVARVLEVADGFIAMLDGRFPADPPAGAWFLGTGDGYQVMRYAPDALTTPRWPRRTH